GFARSADRRAARPTPDQTSALRNWAPLRLPSRVLKVARWRARVRPPRSKPEPGSLLHAVLPGRREKSVAIRQRAVLPAMLLAFGRARHQQPRVAKASPGNTQHSRLG